MQVAVMGRMRTGTTVFRQWLGSPQNAFDLGEVFFGESRHAHNFWNYLFELAKADRKYLNPVLRAQAWRQFMTAKRQETGAEIVVFDLKTEYLNFVLNYDGVAYRAFCLDDDTRLVRLKRRNAARTALSQRLAESTGRWFQLVAAPPPHMLERYKKTRDVEVNGDLPRAKLFVDPAALSAQIAGLIAQDEEIDRIFAGRFDAHFIYEDLMDAHGVLRRDAADAMAAVLGVPSEAFCAIPALARQSSADLLDGVANAEEVRLFFNGTPYRWMFEDAG